MTVLKFFQLLSLLFVLSISLPAPAAPAQPKAKKSAEKRTVIRVPVSVRTKMKDLSAVLQMVKITPLVNDQDEMVGVELGEISEMDIVNILKAQNGDVIKEVQVSRKVNGKVTKTTYSILSPTDVMGMYSALIGASSAEVDIKRGKTILPMTYLLD